MHITNKIITFKSEIYIKFNGSVTKMAKNIIKCANICQEYVQGNKIDVIFTPTNFVNDVISTNGIIITIINNPKNPKEESILRKHTFTLAYKLQSIFRDYDIYGMYNDITFNIVITDEKE